MCLVLKRWQLDILPSLYIYIYFVSDMWDTNNGGRLQPDLDKDAENNKCHREREKGKNEGGNDSKWKINYVFFFFLKGTLRVWKISQLI